MQTRVVAQDLLFPECPRWHDGALYFSDQHDGVVWRVATDGGLDRVVDVPGQPSGIGWLPDGSMVVVSMLDRQLLRVKGTSVETLADLSGGVSHSLNDLVVDRAGRSYVGNFGFDLNNGDSPCGTALLCVQPDGSISVAAEDVWFPNGAVIAEDGRTMILAETFGARLTAFDIAEDGRLGNRRLWAPLEGLFPDGICLDAEGAVWVTCAMGGKVIRVREGGDVADTIPLPEGRQAFACMLGGEERRDLYLCTAPHFLPHITKPARAGCVEVVQVEVPGAGLP